MTTPRDRRPHEPVSLVTDWVNHYRPVVNLLPAFKDYGNGRGRAVCPCDHGGKNADLWVSLGDRGRLLLKCFPRDSSTPACDSKCVMDRLGLPMTMLFPDWEQKTRPPAKPTTTRRADPMRDRDPDEKFVTEAEYEYWDVTPEGHRHLAYVVTKKRGDKGSKDFPCKRPNPDFDPSKPRGKENEQWVYSLKGVRRILYRRADLVTEFLNGGGKRWVLVPEGEKDVETAWRLGFLGTCNPGGVLKWVGPKGEDEYTQDLKGRNVILLCDEDQVAENIHKHGQYLCPGIDHVRQVAGALVGKAAVVKLLRLPGVPFGGDLTDWVQMREADAKKNAKPFDAAEELKKLMSTAMTLKTQDDVAAIVPRGERQWPIPEGHLPQSEYVPAPKDDKAKKATTPDLTAQAEEGKPSAVPPPDGAVAALLKKVADLKLAAPTGPRSAGEWLGEVYMAWKGYDASLPHLLANDPKVVRDAALYLAAQLLRGLDAVPELRGGG